MFNKTIRIGGASGAWGDSQEGPAQLVHKGDIDYLVFDYLAEITMSILAKAYAKSDQLGYATDFVTSAMKPLIKDIAKKKIKVIANAGGVNLKACQAALQKVADEAGVTLRVGIIEGDNLLDRADEFRAAGVTEMGTGKALPENVMSINAYLGALPIAAALDAGADIVITGRVVDSAVSLGALMHEFGWQADEYDKLAAGTLVGHLLECGCQATGGNFTDWKLVADDWDNMGFPIAECRPDGSFIMTKPEGTGGLVSPHTVGEQMLYEIGDPQAYIVPDVVCDFSRTTLKQVAENQVLVENVYGYPPTDTYKVCATFADGYKATHSQTFTGFDAPQKARAMAQAGIRKTQRMFKERGFKDYRNTAIHLIGTGTLWGHHAGDERENARELVLKIDVYHDQREAVDLFSKEIVGTGLSMSTGRCAAGAPGRPKISPVARLFSFLLDKANVPIRVDVDGESVTFNVPTQGGYDPQSVERQHFPEMEVDLRDASAVQLIELAVARSGDKGNDANVGVIARKQEFIPYIKNALTTESVAKWFSHVCEGPVERFELPGTNAFNFLLHDALGGGGVGSLNLDVQAKTYAQQLLAFPVLLPRTLLSS